MKFYYITFLTVLIGLISCNDEHGELKVFSLYFEEGSSVVYDYTQEGTTAYRMLCDLVVDTQVIEAKGIIEIRGTDTEIASFIMANMEITTFMLDNGVPGEKNKQKNVPAQEIPGLQSNGSFGKGEDMDLKFDLLFNLPPVDIQLGETTIKKISFPVNAYGNTTSILADKMITYDKDTMINGDSCAILSYQINNIGIEKSESFRSDSYGVIKGEGLVFFNLNKHEVEGAKNFLSIDMFIRLSGENEECMGMKMEDKSTFWRKND